MIKFSFIIPVYKAEKYLDKCINSILNQSFKQYEILLVDDGSPDNSGLICDGYSEKYSFIHTFHNQNGGASAARNFGLRKASGDYVIFLDSDDYWIDSNGLQKVYEKAILDPDIIVFASKNYYEKNDTFSDDRYNYINAPSSGEAIDYLRYMISNDLYNVHPGKRATKKSFLLDNDLFYKEGIRSEDIELAFRVSNCLPTYQYVNEKLYVYCHHEGSVTTTIGEKHLNEYWSIISEYASWDKFVNNEIKELLLSYLGYQLALLSAYTWTIKPSNYLKFLSEQKKCAFLYSYTQYPRTGMISRMNKFMGFYVTSFCLGIYLKRGN